MPGSTAVPGRTAVSGWIAGCPSARVAPAPDPVQSAAAGRPRRARAAVRDRCRALVSTNIVSSTAAEATAKPSVPGISIRPIPAPATHAS